MAPTTRRQSRSSAFDELSSPNPKNAKANKSGKANNHYDENDDSNRLSGVFDELTTLNTKGSPAKNKFAGSLFAAKIIDQPRRKSTAAEKLLPMKKTAQPKKSKPVKKKPVAAPAPSESEFDNMSEMFGTSPVALRTAEPVKQQKRTPLRNGTVAKKTTSVFQDEEEEETTFGHVNHTIKPTRLSPTKKPVHDIPIKRIEPIKTETIVDQEAADQLHQRFDDLQKRFEKLNMLKTTSAEDLLNDYKKHSAARDLAAQNLIESLKQENAMLKDKLDTINKSRRDSNVSMMSVATSVSGSAESASIIDLYRNLSGLQITTMEDSKWSCLIDGRHGAYSFELEYDAEEAEYTYTPVFTKESTVWDRLPSYLKEEIVFGEGYLQSFFWRALNFLMSQ